MMNTQFTPLAVSDLTEIRDYIALDSPETAVKYIKKLHSRCVSISDFPRSGAELSKRIKTKVKYRYITVDDYIIFYLIAPDAINIIRILHGSRNLEKIFK